MKKLFLVSAAFVLGVLANSFDIERTKPYENSTPVPEAVQSKDPKMVNRGFICEDKQIYLDIFGIGKKEYEFNEPIITYRTITNPVTGKIISGRLDSEGDIHDKEGVYRLQFNERTEGYKKIK